MAEHDLPLVRANLSGWLDVGVPRDDLRWGPAVVEGTTTWSGVRFENIAAEFRDIGPGLAVGLGLRSQAFATAIIVGGAH